MEFSITEDEIYELVKRHRDAAEERFRLSQENENLREKVGKAMTLIHNRQIKKARVLLGECFPLNSISDADIPF